MRPPKASQILVFLLTALYGVLPYGGYSQESDFLALQTNLIKLYKEHASAVVRVNVGYEDLDENGKPSNFKLISSGFFISDTGRILTNSTALPKGIRIWIEKDGLSYVAELIGYDSKTGIGLLQVINLPKTFSYISLAHDNPPPPISTLVLTITSPLDFKPTPALGMINGFESNFFDDSFPFTYSRISISLSDGETGSPVLDLSGNLVGITVGNIPQVRSSYIVPFKALKKIVKDILKDGKVHYGTIPVTFAERPDPLRGSKQIYISSIIPNSSAEKAGLKVGDILHSIRGANIQSKEDIRNLVFHSKIGDFLIVEIKRNEGVLDFAIPVEKPLVVKPAAFVEPRPEPTEEPLLPDVPTL
ncbi:MAG: serine protease [Opitutaceae bacterium]|nr:serine protease [Opitutaceae bacterium]